MQKIWILRVGDLETDFCSNYAFSTKENAIEYGEQFLPKDCDKEDYENYIKYGEYYDIIDVRCIGVDTGMEF
jgi:hypothetical protein